MFAISATLLALDIRVPAGLSSAPFLPALRDQLPGIAAYAFSFGVIGQLWLFHHRIFGLIVGVEFALAGAGAAARAGVDVGTARIGAGRRGPARPRRSLGVGSPKFARSGRRWDRPASAGQATGSARRGRRMP